MVNLQPAFIGIGASFSGLGLVTKCLAAHPEVATTIHAHNFFSTDSFSTKGLAWYESQFEPTKKPVLQGDCSPSYLVTPGTAERIVTSYPDAKVFVVVRNPIDRAIAEFEHAKMSGKIGRTIPCSRYVTTAPTAQSNGFYGQHLHEYFIYYSPLQLHIIVYEELVENPLKVVQALYAFLGIAATFIPKQLSAYAPPPEEPKHPSRLYRLRQAGKRLFRYYFKKSPPPVFPPAYLHTQYFTLAEQLILKAVCAVDARHLTNLMHRDMITFWDLEPNKTEPEVR